LTKEKNVVITNNEHIFFQWVIQSNEIILWEKTSTVGNASV